MTIALPTWAQNDTARRLLVAISAEQPTSQERRHNARWGDEVMFHGENARQLRKLYTAAYRELWDDAEARREYSEVEAFVHNQATADQLISAVLCFGLLQLEAVDLGEGRFGIAA